jgi:hypothetical protein
VSLIILVVLGVVAGLVLARAFGAAAARNEKRPGDEQDDEKPAQTGSAAEDYGKSGGDRQQTRLFFRGPRPCSASSWVWQGRPPLSGRAH